MGLTMASFINPPFKGGLPQLRSRPPNCHLLLQDETRRDEREHLESRPPGRLGGRVRAHRIGRPLGENPALFLAGEIVVLAQDDVIEKRHPRLLADLKEVLSDLDIISSREDSPLPGMVVGEGLPWR